MASVGAGGAAGYLRSVLAGRTPVAEAAARLRQAVARRGLASLAAAAAAAFGRTARPPARRGA
jgi:hypothetical protein